MIKACRCVGKLFEAAYEFCLVVGKFSRNAPTAGNSN